MLSIFQAFKSFANNKIYINFKCFCANIFAFIDSGSNISIIQKDFIQRIYPENTLHVEESDIQGLKSFSNHSIKIFGKINLPIKINNKLFRYKFYIISKLGT